MKSLVDIDRAVSDGLLSPDQGRALRLRAREETVAFGINLFLVSGILSVLAGLAALFPEPQTLIVAGVGSAAAGIAALLRLGTRYALPANAAVVIGVAAGLGGALMQWVEVAQSPAPAIRLGLATALAGMALRGLGGPRLQTAGAWTAVLGAAAWMGGIAAANPDPGPELAAKAAATLALLGIGLDLRILTALAAVALAGTLSATGYEGGGYWLAVERPSLLIGLMLGLSLPCALGAALLPERLAAHARIAGLMGFIWINLGLWIGSIWGDTLAAPLGGEAVLVLPDWGFAIAWAAVILGVGLWAGASDRTPVLNAAATFGAIHFYTQWFSRLEASAASILAAGLLAIGAAWVLLHIRTRR